MNRTPLASALATALIALATAASAATPPPDRLTIYSGDFDAVSQSEGQPGGPGFALIERQIGFDMRAGDNHVPLTGLPAALDASSVVLKPRGDARVTGQRFDFALAGQDELLRRALGQSVTVEQAVGNERQTYTGTLVSAGNGLTLRLPDGRIKVLSGYASFELPRLPEGVVNEPTMNWSLASARGGHQDFDLSYASAGLAWRAEYTINAQGIGTDCRLALDGAAMVVNRSGADFDDVMLTLVAGEPNRARRNNGYVAVAMAAPAPSRMLKSDSTVEPEASGEYQAYKLPNPGSLPQGSVQRLPLVTPATNVACERRYETTASYPGWAPPYPVLDKNFGGSESQDQAVIASLRFKNDRAVGLGVPLPAGRVRMFDGDDFLGEANLGHTPAGNEIALTVGNVFDLTAERKREDFQLDRSGRTLTETISLTLRNAKPQAATIRVNEHLPRWSDWEILKSSTPFVKRAAQAVSFDVTVPASGETRLSYTVRYRWAADVKIP